MGLAAGVGLVCLFVLILSGTDSPFPLFIGLCAWAVVALLIFRIDDSLTAGPWLHPVGGPKRN